MAKSEVIELRIHGVSGTPPEDLLDCPLVTQVAGDNKAGFYRPRLPQERHDPRLTPDGTSSTTGPLLEGYAWGGLTSGAPTRALWLTLLPFTLINVAPRLRPAGDWPKLVWLLWFVSRLLALSMTMLIVAALSGVGVNLIGWQCITPPDTGGVNCSKAAPGWLFDPLLQFSFEHRLAAGALVPLAVLLLLWQVSGRTINNYERVKARFGERALPTDLAPKADPDDVETSLGSPWMWRNEQQVRRLRHLHMQAGVATTLWIITGPFVERWTIVRYLLAVLLACYVVAMLCVPSYTGRARRAGFSAVNYVVWAVVSGCAVVVGLALMFGAPLRELSHESGLRGFADTGQYIFWLQLGLFVVFWAVIVIMGIRGWGSRDPFAPTSLRNQSAVLILAIGVFLGAVFSAGVYVFSAAWLRTGSVKLCFDEVSNSASRFDVPSVILNASEAYAISVGVLVVTIVVLAAGFGGNRLLRALKLRRWPSTKDITLLESDYKDAVMADPYRAKQVAKIFWFGRLVNYAHLLLLALVAAGLIITFLFAFAELPLPSDGFLSARSLQGAGGYLAVLTLLLLVGLAAAAFRVPKTRRSVGILWDLASFWPRSAHPFGAPCYAERGIPDLVTRIYWHAGQEQHGMVLAAHSQGTVLTAATLFQLAERDRALPGTEQVLPRIAFLSFGCVLRRLYARYFPAYFSTSALLAVQTLLKSGNGQVRWGNLWRHSDYLGGQVVAGPPPIHNWKPDADMQFPLDPAIEVEFRDPQWDRPAGDTRYPAASRHSNYWRDPEFPKEVAKLAAMLPGPPPGEDRVIVGGPDGGSEQG